MRESYQQTSEILTKQANLQTLNILQKRPLVLDTPAREKEQSERQKAKEKEQKEKRQMIFKRNLTLKGVKKNTGNQTGRESLIPHTTKSS